MKTKRLISLLLASALTAGMTVWSMNVFATNDDPITAETQDEVGSESISFSWNRGSEEGITVEISTSADEAVLLKRTRLVAATYSDDDMSVTDGQVYIGASVLETLDNGENNLHLFTKDKYVSLKINIIDDDPAEGENTPEEENDNGDGSSAKNEISEKIAEKYQSLLETISNIRNRDDSDEEIYAEQTEYTWDVSELIGISVDTNSRSRTVTIMKDDEIFATNQDTGVYILSGRVGITAKILKGLDLGDNELTFVFDDGSVTVNVEVTDEKNEPVESDLFVDETDFVWDRNDEEGIMIQTNSGSKRFSVKRDGIIFSSSIVDKNISIDDGMITLDIGFLKRLRNGENLLTLVLKEGEVDITVTVLDEGSGEGKDISADQTYFIWDRSNPIGIAVVTDSDSRSVTVTKDGEEIFTDVRMGVYVTFGRVGITARCLRQLENGENELVLNFSDGEIPITVNVTDRRNPTEIETELVAEQTYFTWKRDSGKSITIKTNSDSDTVSVRRSDRLSLISGSENVSVSDGAVTLTPEYLETLSDGKNELTLIFDDGQIDVTVNVVGTQSGGSYTPSSSSGSSSGSSSFTGLIPQTGSTMMTVGILILAAISATISVVISMKKRKNDKD